MRRADYMASIVKQVGKLSTDALRYLDQWSFPWGVIPILKAYDDGKLLRRVDCDMEVALAMDEIVRCRDCKHFTPKGTHKFENGKVNADYCKYVRGWMLQITPDCFCAWGERREP